MYQKMTRARFAEILAGDEHSAFTCEGAGLLFDYLESYEDESDEQIEFDLAALRWDFSQAKAAEVARIHDCKEEYIVDYLRERRVYIGATEAGDIIYYANF